MGDAAWLGGDRHYAKKIVFCYYPEEVIPIFKTEHLEHFLRILGLLEEAYRKAQAMFQRSYEYLTVGQKYELLNGLLSGFKEGLADFKDMDNALFAHNTLGMCLASLERLIIRENKPIKRCERR